MAEIDKKNIEDKVNVVVVSDHGIEMFLPFF